MLVWFLTLVAVAVAVVLVVQRFARRFLPLAWLFTLTHGLPRPDPVPDGHRPAGGQPAVPAKGPRAI